MIIEFKARERKRRYYLKATFNKIDIQRIGINRLWNIIQNELSEFEIKYQMELLASVLIRNKLCIILKVTPSKRLEITKELNRILNFKYIPFLRGSEMRFIKNIVIKRIKLKDDYTLIYEYLYRLPTSLNLVRNSKDYPYCSFFNNSTRRPITLIDPRRKHLFKTYFGIKFAA